MEAWSAEGLRPLRRSKRVNHTGTTTREKVVTPVLANANPQLGCAFLTRLPTEIRILIYSFAATFQVVHVRRTFPPLHESLVAWGGHCKQGDVCNRQCKHLAPRDTPRRLAVLGPPMACRLMYAESIPIVYQHICFLFTELRSWKVFCDNLLKFQTFTYGSLQSLRSVQIDFRVFELRTFTADDEATLCASLEMLTERASGLKNLYIHLAPRSEKSTKLKPVTANLFRVLSKLRGLVQFQFSVHHPLNTIPMERLSLQGARQRREFEDQVVSLSQMLDECVHQPREARIAGIDSAFPENLPE